MTAPDPMNPSGAPPPIAPSTPILPDFMVRSSTHLPLTPEQRAVIVAISNLRERFPTTTLENIRDPVLATLIGCSVPTIRSTRDAASARSCLPDAQFDKDKLSREKGIEDLDGIDLAVLPIVLDHPKWTPLAVLHEFHRKAPGMAHLITTAPAIRRRMERLIPYRLAVKRPGLTDAQKAARLDWLIRSPATVLRRVVWTDEVSIARLGNAYRWITCDEMMYDAVRVSQPESHMLWGAFSFQWGATPCHIWAPQTHVDSAKYVTDILDGILGPWLAALGPLPANERPIIMQDGARPHWGPAAQAWFAARAGQCELMLGWPAHSPDMNPIEFCWAPLKSIVNAADPRAGTMRELMYTAWAIVSRREKTVEGGDLWKKHQENLEQVLKSRGDNRHRTA